MSRQKDRFFGFRKTPPRSDTPDTGEGGTSRQDDSPLNEAITHEATDRTLRLFVENIRVLQVGVKKVHVTKTGQGCMSSESLAVAAGGECQYPTFSFEDRLHPSIECNFMLYRGDFPER